MNGNQCDVCNVSIDNFININKYLIKCFNKIVFLQEGYWNISETGCQQCSCDEIGSINNICDSVIGHCVCKPGIGGQYCEQCLPNYYGFSILGCSGS